MVVRGPAAFFLQFKLGQQRDLQIRLQPRSALFHKDRDQDRDRRGLGGLVVVWGGQASGMAKSMGMSRHHQRHHRHLQRATHHPIHQARDRMCQCHQALLRGFQEAVVAEVAQAIGRGQVR